MDSCNAFCNRCSINSQTMMMIKTEVRSLKNQMNKNNMLSTTTALLDDLAKAAETPLNLVSIKQSSVTNTILSLPLHC